MVRGQRHRHTVGLGGAGAEAAGDVRADHAALLQDVRPVRAIGRVGAVGLVRNLGEPGGTGRRRGCGGGGRRRAGRKSQPERADAGQAEHPTAAQQGADVELETLIDQLFIGMGERTPLVTGWSGCDGWSWRFRSGRVQAVQIIVAVSPDARCVSSCGPAVRPVRWASTTSAQPTRSVVASGF